MGIPYLQGKPWSSWTRDERFFCAVLYGHASNDPAAFATWLIKKAELDATATGEWDLGFEVCFYRDYLWQRGISARKENLPAKRTFDLCLFGERDIIIIEAKVCEPFDITQNKEFARDIDRVAELSGLEKDNVHLVALASSKYYANAEEFGDPQTLSMFGGRVEWADLSALYSDSLLAQANGMYGMRPGELLHSPE